MDRLQVKCLAASAGFHLLLAVVLLSSSAFQWRPRSSASSRESAASIIQLVTSPADRETTVPAPAVAKPSHQNAAGSQPTTRWKASEALQRPMQAKPSPDSDAPGRRNLSHSAKPAAVNSSRLVEFSRLLEDMAHRPPVGKAIELELGTAAGAKDDAYAKIVRFLYSQSWEPAGNENTNPKAAAKAKVTITSDGKVFSAQIIESSGDARLDESVRQTLDRVQFVEPFEPGAKDSERTYTINFTVHAALTAEQ